MTITMPLHASLFSAALPHRRVTTATVPVTIYDNHWRRTTQRIGRVLDRAGVVYQYVDLHLRPDAEHELRIVAGPEINTPIVYVDGDWLISPTLGQVEEALERHGVTVSHSTSPLEAIKGSEQVASDRFLPPLSWKGVVRRHT